MRIEHPARDGFMELYKFKKLVVCKFRVVDNYLIASIAKPPFSVTVILSQFSEQGAGIDIFINGCFFNDIFYIEIYIFFFATIISLGFVLTSYLPN